MTRRGGTLETEADFASRTQKPPLVQSAASDTLGSKQPLTPLVTLDSTRDETPPLKTTSGIGADTHSGDAATMFSVLASMRLTVAGDAANTRPTSISDVNIVSIRFLRECPGSSQVSRKIHTDAMNSKAIGSMKSSAMCRLI